MAYTIDGRVGAVAATKLASTLRGLKVMEQTIDCATTNVGSGISVPMIHIPAGCLVGPAILDVETAEGGTLTCDVGHFTTSTEAVIDIDEWVDGRDCNDTLGALNTTAGDGAAAWYPTTVPIDICLTFNNAADKAKLTVRVPVIELT